MEIDIKKIVGETKTDFLGHIIDEVIESMVKIGLDYGLNGKDLSCVVLHSAAVVNYAAVKLAYRQLFHVEMEDEEAAMDIAKTMWQTTGVELYEKDRKRKEDTNE